MRFEELFKLGGSYNEFLLVKEGEYKEKLESLVNEINIPLELKKRIENISENINILAVAELWCPDCIVNVPSIVYISDLNSKVSISFVKREGNEEYLNNFSVEGKVKIPTFIIMDRDFKLKGAFIERPNSIKDLENGDDQVKRIVGMKNYRQGKCLEEVIEEILDIIES
ncbi:thioredoxin family protein [Hathewaya histolytica]|uniref:thioredoxin family protein n=1 Tax=Hathewaya histolytica TaxID=1498 RepID=UPI003B68331C